MLYMGHTLVDFYFVLLSNISALKTDCPPEMQHLLIDSRSPYQEAVCTTSAL